MGLKFDTFDVDDFCAWYAKFVKEEGTGVSITQAVFETYRTYLAELKAKHWASFEVGDTIIITNGGAMGEIISITKESRYGAFKYLPYYPELNEFDKKVHFGYFDKVRHATKSEIEGYQKAKLREEQCQK